MKLSALTTGATLSLVNTISGRRTPKEVVQILLQILEQLQFQVKKLPSNVVTLVHTFCVNLLLNIWSLVTDAISYSYNEYYSFAIFKYFILL